MALKVLMLRKKKDSLEKQLRSLKESVDFKKREQELATAINELNEDSTDDEQKIIQEEVDKLESDKKEYQNKVDDLEKQIKDVENEIEEEEGKQPQPEKEKKEERKGEPSMETRTKFYGMTIQERNVFFEREDIKTFLSEVRTCIREKRALTNVGLTIPEVMLPLLKQKIEETSKLLKYVTAKSVAGNARQNIMGDIPEAIWTEMCGTLNQLDLQFNNVEVDGYKVGGFFAVCNAVLEDNDVNLATELIDALGKSIGKALDKAIVFGKGTKMPLGAVTRLAQAAKPSDYPATARDWVDLTKTNIITGTGKTGIALFKEIIGNIGVISNNYYDTGLVWVMNRKTHMKLITESIDKNLNAAIVAGINDQMPVVGGTIEELEFMPDDNIFVGYLGAYILVERAETSIGQSEHVRFIEDQTVFKGTARYDGKPAIAEAFALMTISTDAPTTAVNFAEDKANTSS